ncbi:glycogen debranching enzyme [Salmonella enterica subsp. enterica]|uniref:Glycogen debranching enzyme n=1 Tax=Salmonella enterica I TaxID=59201 RepID=A0A3S4HR59_SALET|nr:glycogen debranching enzyme [Salmonella enterica subsp. enterica]
MRGRVEGELKDHPLLHGGHDEPDYRDNAAVAPKSVVISDHYDWEDDAAPRTPWGKTVIYEAACQRAYLPASGTPPRRYAAPIKRSGHPVMVAYFKQLGITALETVAGSAVCQRAAPATYGG